MKKQLPILFLALTLAICNTEAFTQRTEISMTTDLGVMRSFKEGQKFWSFGHTIQAQFHVSRKDAIYVWLSYYLDGDFENNLTATAKSPTTTPQDIAYTNEAEMGLKQFSVGYKRYLKGDYANSNSNNVYGYAGLGILFGISRNEITTSLDTSLYFLRVEVGEEPFKRLTLDLGLGIEFPVGNSMFIYGEGRAWLPTTDFPSKYLYVNRDAPIMGMINVGLRVLFD